MNKTGYGKGLTVKRKCVYVLCLLIFCRILSGIPTPFVNREYVKGILDSNGAFGIMNMLTGNSLSSLSIMALGITPYITASIVIQLLGVAFPKIDEMNRGMADDRKKMDRIMIAVGCGFSALQGIAMCVGFGRSNVIASDKWYAFMLIILIWTAGTFLEIMIGMFITKNLIGNGVSLILLANILSSYPSDAYSLFQLIFAKGKTTAAMMAAVAVIAVVVAMFAFTVFVEGCEKRISVYYTRKVGGYNSPMTGSYIPIKLCPGGVIPVIFASSLFSMPGIIAQIAGKSNMAWLRFFDTTCWFNSAFKPYYSFGALVYIFMIFGFSYYYVGIELNPVQTSIDIKKAGGVIPGVRQGKDTSNYLRKNMKYTVFIGAAALALIAMIPIVLGGLFSVPRVAFLGTSIIIACGVILETKKAVMAEYKGENRRSRKRGGIINGKKRNRY